MGPGLLVLSDVAYQLTQGLSSGYNQSYLLWNASLGRQLFAGQRGELMLFDLLQQNRAIQRTVSVADVQTNVLQRYFLLLFTYNIRSANVVLPAGDEPENGQPRGGGGRRRGVS